VGIVSSTDSEIAEGNEPRIQKISRQGGSGPSKNQKDRRTRDLQRGVRDKNMGFLKGRYGSRESIKRIIIGKALERGDKARQPGGGLVLRKLPSNRKIRRSFPKKKGKYYSHNYEIQTALVKEKESSLGGVLYGKLGYTEPKEEKIRRPYGRKKKKDGKRGARKEGVRCNCGRKECRKKTGKPEEMAARQTKAVNLIVIKVDTYMEKRVPTLTGGRRGGG